MGKVENIRYSEKELKEFENIILEKLNAANAVLKDIKSTLTKSAVNSTDAVKVLEAGADTLEKENLNQLAARQQKFIGSLENALIRIKNSTYGVCVVTGKLINKDRLKAVPHTTHSIEAKLNQQ